MMQILGNRRSVQKRAQKAGSYVLKEGVLSAFLPPVGRRSLRSRKIDVFLYSKQLCFEIISLITSSLRRMYIHPTFNVFEIHMTSQ